MSKHDLTIRPAINADKSAVLAFCATTWDDGDYIHEVWDEWFHDPHSTLLIGTLHDEPVSVAHVSVVDGEGWFEGLRVARGQRGQGFGRLMLQASLDEARRRDARVLRLITIHTNTVMTTLLPRLGFVRCFDATWFSASTNTAPPPQVVSDSFLAMLEPALTAAPLLRETGGLYADGWSFRTLTPARLAQHHAAGQVVQVPGVEGWAIVMPDGESTHQAIAVAAGDVVALFAGLRAYPPAQTLGEIRAFLPIDGATAEMAQAAGYRPRPNRFGIYAHYLGKQLSANP